LYHKDFFFFEKQNSTSKSMKSLKKTTHRGDNGVVDYNQRKMSSKLGKTTPINKPGREPWEAPLITTRMDLFQHQKSENNFLFIVIYVENYWKLTQFLGNFFSCQNIFQTSYFCKINSSYLTEALQTGIVYNNCLQNHCSYCLISFKMKISSEKI
jgi:hypothetical protein